MIANGVIPKCLRPGRISLRFLAMVLALAGASPFAHAQFSDGMGGSSQNLEGFTVAGKGFVTAKPNLIEIELDISAASELTADAIVKYRDAKRRLHDAFSSLKLENVAVTERGLAVEEKGLNQSPYYFNDMPNPRAKTEVQLSRKLIAKATDIRKMDEEAVLQLVAKLIDVAQDAGAKVGPQVDNWRRYYYGYGNSSNGLVHFVLEDFDEVQEQAYEKAIADARARAERLARLSHVELGPILAVREIVVPGEAVTNGFNPYYYNGSQQNDDEHLKKRLETSKYQEIPVRVELLVRFGVRPKGQENARTGGQPK
jgi:uncharacterized protein YggE